MIKTKNPVVHLKAGLLMTRVQKLLVHLKAIRLCNKSSKSCCSSKKNNKSNNYSKKNNYSNKKATVISLKNHVVVKKQIMSQKVMIL